VTAPTDAGIAKLQISWLAIQDPNFLIVYTDLSAADLATLNTQDLQFYH
jgi:hypothetical protein